MGPSQSYRMAALSILSLALAAVPALAMDCKVATVQSGNTCFSIATSAGITTTQLSSDNPGLDCNTLWIGQKLCVSPGTLPGQPQTSPDGACATYTTVSGDSCSAIAAKDSITVANIENWNAKTYKWTGCSGLQVGYTMCVSAGTPPPIPIDPNAQCGVTSKNNATCPLNACCSAFGFCGLTDEFCTTTGSNPCQTNCFQPTIPTCPTSKITRKLGYYAGWANKRACTTFGPSQLDLNGYTHVHYAFATIAQDLTISLSGDDDPLLRQLVSMKSQYSGLKVIIAVGGWAFSEDDNTKDLFTVMISDSSNRATFINSVKIFLSAYGVDGIDIDFEYPAAVERSAPATDTPNLTSFFTEMRKALPEAVISAATPAGYWFLRGFEINKIASQVTYLNMMSYDYHGPWDTNVTDQAPVTNPHTSILDMQVSTELYIRANISLSQVNLGLAWYGRTFHLADTGCKGYNCIMTGGGAPGECTQASGILAQFEVMSALGSATPTLDSNSGTYWFNTGGDLITFDQPNTWQAKQSFAANSCFGGTFVWSFDQVTPTKPVSSPTTTAVPTTTSTTYPSPTGCPELASAAKAQASQVMNDFVPQKCIKSPKDGSICDQGEFLDHSDSQHPRLWTDIITVETLYNYMWAESDANWESLVWQLGEVPAVSKPETSPPSNTTSWTGYFSSFDDAGWTAIMYVKVQEYFAAHGQPDLGATYMSLAVSLHAFLAKQWDDSLCNGGLPQQSTGGAKSTITTELFFHLSAVLYLQTKTQSFLTWAQKNADWFLTGPGSLLRDRDGLWWDSLGVDGCNSVGAPKWSYNQGVIVSALGMMYEITGDQKYKDAATATIDAVVNGGGSESDVQVVNGILKEPSDDVVTGCSFICSDLMDHYAFKGIFMKHLQYFLDSVNDNALAYKYSSFIGAQASAIIHFAIGSDGVAGNCWYAPNKGGSVFNPKTKNSGLDGLLAGLKYARC